jgi:hypothetical protein
VTKVVVGMYIRVCGVIHISDYLLYLGVGQKNLYTLISGFTVTPEWMKY